MIDRIRAFGSNSKIISECRENVTPMGHVREVILYILLFLLLILIQSMFQAVFYMMSTDPVIRLLLFFTSFIIVPFIIYFYVTKIEHRNLRSIGFSEGDAISSTVKGLLIGFTLFTTVLVIGLILGQFKYNGFDLSSCVYLIPFFVAIGIQSFGEEMYTRGWTITYFSKRHDIITTILVSCIAFVAPHLLNNGIDLLSVINISLFGLLFAIMFLRFDNLWICGGLHTAWNFTQGILYGFNVSGISTPSLLKFSQVGQNVINGGIFGPESSLITSIITILAILICVYYRR